MTCILEESIRNREEVDLKYMSGQESRDALKTILNVT